ncbi:unnamed protein product [Paramecium octaurelia]|uniref:Uncharacterized protein n=1 Tax=Paramecium octaurelia TaxID=43137 RepID=A0A8S1TL07_PAROT|nr:unnamed protein product [Paramecium octaurelia]
MMWLLSWPKWKPKLYKKLKCGLRIFLKLKRINVKVQMLPFLQRRFNFRVNEIDLNQLFSRFGFPNSKVVCKTINRLLIVYSSILFLEWAPITLMGEMTKNNEINQQIEEQEYELNLILIVKNLNFSITEKISQTLCPPKVNDLKATLIHKEECKTAIRLKQYDFQ